MGKAWVGCGEVPGLCEGLRRSRGGAREKAGLLRRGECKEGGDMGGASAEEEGRWAWPAPGGNEYRGGAHGKDE